MAYIDGMVAAVPTANKEIYRAYSARMGETMKRYGALRYVETWGDDVPEGNLTSFSMAVQRKEDEVVVFSWVWWPDKAAHDDGWKRMMEDPAMNNFADMPFDGKRMIFGGFEVLLDV
jgi:uncharacterized protein YbaA (DUF1428 family)